MSEVAKVEPQSFIQGDTVKWTISLPTDKDGNQYLASDSWLLSYNFRGPASINLIMTGISPQITASGGDFAIVITAAQSALYTIGDYWWESYITKTAERYLVGSGGLEIKQNLAATLATYDGRSHAKIVLDAIEAVIEGRATTAQLICSIGGRSIQSWDPRELLKFHATYKGKYLAEQRKDCIRRGLSAGNNVLVRFK